MDAVAGTQRQGRTRAALDVAVKAGAALAVISLALEYGFHEDPDRGPVPAWIPIGVQLFAVALYVLQNAHAILSAADRWIALKRRWLDVSLIAGGVVLIVLLAEAVHQPVLKASAIYVVALQVLLVLRFGIGLVRLNLAASQSRLHPARLMVLSFVVVIVIGGLLLSLPRAAVPSGRHEEAYYLWAHLRNCFFTATSATCVTGLTVYDTGTEFSRFGQIVILALIQIGGLGIMVFGTLFGVLAGRRLSLRQSLVLQDAMSHHTIGRITQMVRLVVLVTFGCEAIGAALLYSMWPASVGPWTERLFYSVFHSVSAFCNAGFALEDQSLIPYRGAWGVYVCIMPLIVIGGLGFPVLHDVHAWLKSLLVRPGDTRTAWGIRIPRVRPGHQRHRFSLHSRLVGWTTVILITLPAIAIFAFESSDWRRPSQMPTTAAARTAVMADMTPADRAAAALFQSVTARTAGFNTAATDVNSMSPASHFLTCLLMFVGGSPASTAGGVKTAAVAVMLLAVYNTLRRRSGVESFGRTIPVEVVRRAGVVIIVMFAVVAAVTLLLCYTERGVALQRILFESVSACGTVGLSTGLTKNLTGAGRLIIMAAMFAGRLGPLTVLIALAGREVTARYEYPAETVVIG